MTKTHTLLPGDEPEPREPTDNEKIIRLLTRISERLDMLYSAVQAESAAREARGRRDRRAFGRGGG